MPITQLPHPPSNPPATLSLFPRVQHLKATWRITLEFKLEVHVKEIIVREDV